MRGRLCLVGLVALLGASCTTASGEKIGTITKLSQEGPICPTWEGQIIRGGISGGTGAFGAPFDFTIPENRYQGSGESLVAQVRKYMDEGKEVKLYYTSYFPFLCSSNSGHYVYRVEVK